MHLISPSILSADFSRLGEAVEMINNSEADWIHVDVMDGVFVPNITFGFPVMKSIKKMAKKPLDVHLMIVQPERYILEFKEAGADILTVQYEACVHLHRTIYAIKEQGMKAGVALNPHTPVSHLKDVIADLDLVLIMSVNPGFAAQKFIRQALTKLHETRLLIEANRSGALIEIDGGVSVENAGELINAGANVLVAGNAVFTTPDPAATIQKLKQVSTVAEA